MPKESKTKKVNNEETNEKTTKKSFSSRMQSIPRFIVRQLYRMQYGYTKFMVFVQIMNTVSLLLILFNAAEFFNVEWWHLLIIYVGLILFLLLSVFAFELFGAWHTEPRQIFRMQTSELWREQIELRALLLAKYIAYSHEEIDERIEIVSKKLFPDKYKDSE